jgi:GMP synthase (glutamine-hydrolysing)
MTRATRLLLVQNDHCLGPIRSTYGNVDQHFKNALKLQLDQGAITLDVFALCDTDGTLEPNNFASYDGVIFTGSAAMIDENRPWVTKGISLMRRLLENEVPILGVCFGHQMLGAVCGAKVGPNPSGRMNGSTTVTLKNASDDPLFKDFASPFAVQVSHRDVILEKSAEFEVLGTAPHDPFHVIRAGRSAWGIQFHPEWDVKMSEGYLERKREFLEAERGKGTTDALKKTLLPSEQSASLLNRFAKLCGK